MGELAALWGYEENHEMEQLGQKLLFTTLELEKLKAEAMEEMRKNNEYVKQLIHLLKYALHERDEANNQLHKLLNKSFSESNFPNIPLLQPNSPLIKPAKANSSITESNSLSESVFDAVSSPDFNLVVNQKQNLVQESNAAIMAAPKADQGSLVIDSLVKGRTLPEKGKFLKAVLQAGPLLQTLLVAGPLPRWRNPPQFQPFQAPPVSIKGCEAASHVGQLSSRSLNLQPPYNGQVSFGDFGSGNCLNNGSSLMNSGMNASGYNGYGYAPLAKRQRFSSY